MALRRGVRVARPPRLPGRPGALPEGAAARQPPRRLAARRRPTGLGPRLPPPPAPRRLRHRHRRAEPPPALRPGRPQQRLLRRPDPRGERVAARSLAPARAAAARQRGGALRGRRGLRRRDQEARRRPQFLPGADAEPHGRARRQPALLADLRGGGRGRAARRLPRLRLFRLGDDQHRLAVLLHRGGERARHLLPEPGDEPRRGRRLRAPAQPEGGADRMRLRLAALRRLAPRPPLAPPQGRGAASPPRALRGHPRALLGFHPAHGGAREPPAPAGRDGLDRLGPHPLRHRLPALGLRRPARRPAAHPAGGASGGTSTAATRGGCTAFEPRGDARRRQQPRAAATWSPRWRRSRRAAASWWRSRDGASWCSTWAASSSRCADRCPHQGGSLAAGCITGNVSSSEPGRVPLHPPRRDDPLPLALLGVRHPHRTVPLRPRPGEGAPLRGACRVRRDVAGRAVTTPKPSPVRVEDDYVVVDA